MYLYEIVDEEWTIRTRNKSIPILLYEYDK